MLRNRYIMTPQNEVATAGYKKYLGGIFKEHLHCIPWACISAGNKMISKRVARAKLGIPRDGLVLLSFGAPHSGKDIETIFHGASLVKGVYLVHAGIQAFSLGSSPSRLRVKYGMQKRCKVFDYYVPEEEKPYFFHAADALILSYYERFSSTSSMLWEAAQYRLPVISSNANTLGEDVAKHRLGLLYEAENPHALAATIQVYAASKDGLIKIYKENADKFTRAYGVDRWVDNCKQVYERLMA